MHQFLVVVPYMHVMIHGENTTRMLLRDVIVKSLKKSVVVVAV